MKSLSSAVLSIALVLLASSVAAAGERSGPTLRLLSGVGLATGAYQYRGPSEPGYGVPVHMLEMNSRLTGATVSASAEVGWWLVPCFAVLAEAGASLQVGGSNGGLSATRINHAAGWHALLVADDYLSDRGHLQLGGGYARTGFLSEHDDLGSYDNIVHPSAVAGPMVVLGGGYDLSESFGLLARLSYAHLSNDDSSYHPVTLSFLASIGLL